MAPRTIGGVQPVVLTDGDGNIIGTAANPLQIGSNSGDIVAQGLAAADSGAWPMKITDGTNEVGVSTAGADGQSNTDKRLKVNARIQGLNGTTWDGIRAGISGVVSSILGYINVIGVGRYNATPPTLTDGQYVEPQLDANGNLKIALTSPALATYSAAASFTIAASATDVFAINGSASKTVKVRKMRISGIATAASEVDIAVIKRSTADTGGSSATATDVPHDSQNAAGTAVVKGYTGNPTVGTSVGTVRYVKATVTTSAGAIPNIVYEWVFGEEDQPIVLRGIAEGLCVNLGGVTTTGLVLAISVEWTEE